jgi:2-hydroxy-3-keto-5-methylthiopentenyl-1-phosphate phosphatase
MADHIFARSYLEELCQEKQLSYTPFETFMDVIEVLKAKAEAGVP